MRLRTTSTQRTYRYVRLCLVGAVALLGISVATQIVSGGPLPSISAAFYTPAHDVFVGSLCAMALALLALSGRSLEQALLDIGALLVPVIAFVPPPLAPGDFATGVGGCPTGRSCVPEALLPGIGNSLLSLGVVAVVGIAVVLAIARAQGALDRSVIASVGVAAATVVILGGWWMLSPSTFVAGAHNTAAVVFFALIALVAGLAAWRPAEPASTRRLRLRLAYGSIAGGIVLALTAVIAGAVARTAGDAPGGAPLFFVGEAAALLLFAAFWVVQTIEFWNEVDPRLRDVA